MSEKVTKIMVYENIQNGANNDQISKRLSKLGRNMGKLLLLINAEISLTFANQIFSKSKRVIPKDRVNDGAIAHAADHIQSNFQFSSRFHEFSNCLVKLSI